MEKSHRERLFVCDHPLVRHKLSYLRQPHEITHFRDYERLIEEIGTILAIEATKNLQLESIKNNRSATNSEKPWREGEKLRRKPVVVSTVRTGLVLSNAIRKIVSTPYMGHIGIYKDHNDNSPREFMATMPDDSLNRFIILADMFVVEGETALHAIKSLLEYGIEEKDICIIAIIISHEGRNIVHQKFPFVQMHCALLDSPDNPWQSDFDETNSRLFRTPNRGP